MYVVVLKIGLQVHALFTEMSFGAASLVSVSKILKKFPILDVQSQTAKTLRNQVSLLPCCLETPLTNSRDQPIRTGSCHCSIKLTRKHRELHESCLCLHV